MNTLEQVIEEVKLIFNSYDSYNFESAECFQRCINLLDTYCEDGNILDPRNLDQAQTACNVFGNTSHLFLINHFNSAATEVLIYAWNKFGKTQRSHKKRIYRAGIAMYLAKAYLNLGDQGAAFRWALLTQADDLLGEHAQQGGAGRQMLLTMLGMRNKALEGLYEIAQQHLADLRNQHGDDWSFASGFAESVVTHFALNRPEYSHLFALPSNIHEYPLSEAYYETILESIDNPAPNTTEKGARLEGLASYLFLLLPGLVPRRNLVDDRLSFETDIVVRNLAVTGNLAADMLGRHFLVECKNWESSVRVNDVGYFLYRMRLTHANFGVIFAKKGITGNEIEEVAAYSLIRKAFHEDGNICVVIDKEDLSVIARNEQSFWSILLERIERVRFGKPKSPVA